MYIVLANEVADVDLAEFEKIGSCYQIIAVPNIDVSLGIKGMRSSPLDSIEDCQNTLHLTYEAGDGDLETELLEDPFTAGIIYRRGGRDYVELKYVYHLGVLTLHSYFLIDVNDCTFAFLEDRDEPSMTRASYADLWQVGLIKEVKS